MGDKTLQTSKKSNNLTWLAVAGIGAVTAFNLLRRKEKSQYSFAGKTVLITGGSRGLGLVMARQFADEGAKIAICARTGVELERARTDLNERGAEVLATVCDVREQKEVEEMIENVRRKSGRIDVLINNAGVIQVGPLEVQTEQDFQDALNVHFWGPFYTMQAVIPEMRKRGEGKIVNIASIGGKMNVPHLAPYCASKFALVGLSGAMNFELAKDGSENVITINFDDETVFEKLKDYTGGSGPDACIDAVGLESHGTSPDALFDWAQVYTLQETGRPHALRQASYSCRKDGTVSIPGVYGGFLNQFPMGAAFGKGLTLKMGQTSMHKYLKPLLSAIQEDKIDPTFVISHRLKLSEAPMGYDKFNKYKNDWRKIVLTP